jgi:hypothetical protein
VQGKSDNRSSISSFQGEPKPEKRNLDFDLFAILFVKWVYAPEMM